MEVEIIKVHIHFNTANVISLTTRTYSLTWERSILSYQGLRLSYLTCRKVDTTKPSLVKMERSGSDSRLMGCGFDNCFVASLNPA